MIFAFVIGILAAFLFLLALDGILNNFLAESISSINYGLYLFFVAHKQSFMMIFALLIILLTVYFSISKTANYIDLIVQSIDKIFQKEEDLIELPDDFKEVENKLNGIKFDALRNEQIAKDAEAKKNDLLVYLAHDLKTPLTSVIGYLTLLREEPDLPAEQRQKYINISLEKSERLEDLINEFFEITRFNLQNIVLENKQIHLHKMLDQLVDEFYPLLAEKNLNCQLHMEEQITIRGDADKLARVFDNLLRNAINYSYENSDIDIFVKKDENMVELIFQNQGNPIPEHKLNTIFEKFFRLDTARSSKTGGAGLGLAIAKEIVELHHGSIKAYSSSEYTKFSILLPIK